MKLSPADIEHLADLSHLALGAAEKKKFEEQLSSILDYVNKLQELEKAEAVPTGTEAVNVFREDKVTACDAATRERIIKNFPASVDGLLSVPAVFSETKDDF
ncbi:Asp-tRNA(Asn)/Glu-tRNA(Gln) amidotransferase subunit GatC [Patescibacteria group bacterium]|nr:MAG: Asp-tRNA(Asn)/Glu-tRNA(Gln) amidotransferase subunit GatC [Patescibacteria group bacterium]